MKYAVSTLLSMVIFIIFLALSFLFLGACGISLGTVPFVNFCNPSERSTVSREIELLQEKARVLEISVFQSECVREHINPNTKDQNFKLKDLSDEDVRLWKNQDIGFLRDCWIIQGTQQTYTMINDPSIKFDASDEKYCFDNQGSGVVEVRFAEQGSKCSGSTNASFLDKDTITISNSSSVCTPPNPFSRIIASTIKCELKENGYAKCGAEGKDSEFVLKKIVE